MQLTGSITTGEAHATLRDISRRNGVPRMMFVALIVAFELVGIAISLALTHLFKLPHGDHANDGFGVGLGVFLGGVLYLALARRIGNWRFRQAFRNKALPTVFPLRVEITADHFIYELGDILQMCRWRSVTEVFRSHAYWVFLVQSSAHFAPRRCFADPAAERAFLSAALARMTPEARARSRQAIEFTAWE